MARILIVEDEARISAFVAKGLDADGYTTTVVGDGVSGLDLALSGDFDLAVLDINLPGLDGFTVLEQMRASGSTMPVIVLTARDSVTDTVSALEGGADDYMAKPFRFAELLARVRLRLRQSGEQQGPRDDVLEAGRSGSTCAPAAPRTTAGRSSSRRGAELAEIFLRNPGLCLARAAALPRVGLRLRPGLERGGRGAATSAGLGAESISTVRGLGYRFNP